jgi:Na+/H+ antiporter NhaD/arsenite permease-like protein
VNLQRSSARQDGESRAIAIWLAIPLASLTLLALAWLAATLLGVAPIPSSRWLSWMPTIVAVVIFVVTYFAVAIGRLPGLRVDRAGAVFVGAGLMIAVGVLPLKSAYAAIDFNTIVLLLGVMIVVANLRVSGLLRAAGGWIVERTRHPLTLLVAVVLVTGVLSAFLVNDAICLAMTPLVLEIVINARRNPVPYALAIAMASNIGSTATITGNPQNIIIGSLSNISYNRFAAALSPIAAIGMVLTIVMIAAAYRSEFWTADRLNARLPRSPSNRPLMVKSAIVTLLMVAAFFSGVTPARAAIGAGVILMLGGRMRPQRIYQEIDGPLLLMFVGLFVVVAGFEARVLTPGVLHAIGQLHLGQVAILSTVTGLLSNLVSNVPAVLVLSPFVPSLGNPERMWLTIAMASTLAGNFTILGSIANLIVVQRARGQGVEISFWEYFRIGAPLTLMTIVIGAMLI